MIKVIISNLEGQQTNAASFESRQEADAWFSRHTEMGTWQTEDVRIPAQRDSWDELISEEQIFPKTHSVEFIEDFVDQESINAEARAYLASTDWYIVRFMEQGIAIPMEIHETRNAARSRVV